LKLNTKDEVINLPNIKEYLDANMPKISYEELKTQVKDKKDKFKNKFKRIQAIKVVKFKNKFKS
ncbi:hypothetical protein, partial [Campylobacter fetus]|uniref:hypothetical protein n=1 Tax=Campylobacter fetus TaxID=196 RepID=UPI0013D856C6